MRDFSPRCCHCQMMAAIPGWKWQRHSAAKKRSPYFLVAQTDLAHARATATFTERYANVQRQNYSAFRRFQILLLRLHRRSDDRAKVADGDPEHDAIALPVYSAN